MTRPVRLQLSRRAGFNLQAVSLAANCWCRPGAPCHADVLLELANRCEET